MHPQIPDFLILDTAEAVRNYRSKTNNLVPLGLLELERWIVLVTEAVGIESDFDYQMAVVQYEIAGEFLYEEHAEGFTIVNAIGQLCEDVRAELRRLQCYDERGFCHYEHLALLGDGSIVLQHFQGAGYANARNNHPRF